MGKQEGESAVVAVCVSCQLENKISGCGYVGETVLTHLSVKLMLW